MNLDRFNLNLFVALDAVLEARTLTEAALKLHLTQPGMSVALRKLREHFHDELVVYSGGRQQLTPLGSALKPQVRQLILTSQEILKLNQCFDPETSKEKFRIVANEVVELVFLAPFLSVLAREAPNISISVTTFNYQSVDSIFLNNNDIIFLPESYMSKRYEGEVIITDKFVCIAGSNNDAAKAAAKTGRLASLPRVAIHQEAPHGIPHPMVDSLKDLRGQWPVAIHTASLAAMPSIVAASTLVAVVPLRFAQQCAETMPLQILPLPMPLPDIRIVAQWQQHRNLAPAMKWLLRRIAEFADSFAREEAA